MSVADGGERVSILLVDDRPTNLMSLEALLRRPDYELVLAGSGPEALALVLRQEFALILLDVAMPGMDGFEAASLIKQRDQSKSIPIIFVTASVYDMEHVFRAYAVGAVDYVRKPLDPHAVRAKVDVFVQLYRQRRQIERQAARLREAEAREQRVRLQQAQEELHTSEALYRSTLDEAPVGIGHGSPTGLWTLANRRLGEILGCESSALVGRRIAEMGDGDDAPALELQVARVRAGEGVYSGEHRLAGPGRARGQAWGEVSLSALRDERGSVQRLIIVVEDISDRKRIELDRARWVRELEDGIRARDDFLHVAAHELKTPVTPIRLLSGSLLRDLTLRGAEPKSAEKFTERLIKLDRAAERLGALVDKLLDESKLSLEEISLDLGEVDLSEVARESVARLQDDARRTGAFIAVLAPREVVGSWDALRIDQVVTNLVSNAIKYGNGKPITVEVSATAGTARLSVRDQGMGIPAQAQERIFERFERVAPLRNFGGFGLGLWIVRRVVEAHGGEVSVSSRLGEGSEFVVELPMHPEPEPVRPSEPAGAHP